MPSFVGLNPLNLVWWLSGSPKAWWWLSYIRLLNSKEQRMPKDGKDVRCRIPNDEARKYQNSLALQRIPSVSDNAHELLTVSKCAKHATLDRRISQLYSSKPDPDCWSEEICQFSIEPIILPTCHSLTRLVWSSKTEGLIALALQCCA